MIVRMWRPLPFGVAAPAPGPSITIDLRVEQPAGDADRGDGDSRVLR
jgi:hypothetical protein